MERSLVIIKPDAVSRGLSGAILSRLEGKGLRLATLKMLHLDKDLARQHYAIHRNKPFFSSLVSYISSDPVVVAVFEGEGAVARIREVTGATDPANAGEGTIRGDYGLDIEKNTIHGSDSAETAEMEIGLFFAEDEIF
jgi:nucleoside-diphosphate kinase